MTRGTAKTYFRLHLTSNEAPTLLQPHLTTHAPSPEAIAMEHSAAIMEDAGKAIDGAEPSSSTAPESHSRKHNEGDRSNDRGRENNYDRRKRKRDFSDSSVRHGSRGGNRGRQHGDNKRHQKGDLGRAAYL